LISETNVAIKHLAIDQTRCRLSIFGADAARDDESVETITDSVAKKDGACGRFRCQSLNHIGFVKWGRTSNAQQRNSDVYMRASAAQ
jgi:hypothetical protein